MPYPKAFLFDVFGTVVDWRTGVAAEMKKVFVGKQIDVDPFAFADAWRAKYRPAMERVRSGDRGFVPLDILHRENLDELLADLGLEHDFDDAERTFINRAWEKLPPWPDCRSGLASLKKKAIIAPCSNGSIALMTHLAKFGNLPWDCILGAEIAKNYKPNAAVYLESVSALGLSPEEVVMVAAHNSDLAAARKHGLKTAFIPRPTEYGENQGTDLSPTDEWDYIVEKIDDFSFL